MPLLGKPIRMSPHSRRSPVIASPLGNHPKAVPDISSSLTIPGRVAVSPPASVTLDLEQPSERDSPNIEWTELSVFGVAI